MPLNLPSNVKQDPNTGLYIITNSSGQTFRVNADTQSQLDTYVTSVNTNTPTPVTITDPNTGDPKTRAFDPAAISSTTTAIQNQQQLLTQTKRQTGIIGNADGTYTNLRTGQTLTQEEASTAIQQAGLPPEALTAITPKNSPKYEASTRQVDKVVNEPSNLPNSPEAEATQPPAAIDPDNAKISSDTDPEVAYYQELQRENEAVDEPLSVPPGTDEYDGIDAQVEANENGLAEPPDVPDEDFGEAERLAAEERLVAQEAPDYFSVRGILGPLQETREQGTVQDITNYNQLGDWRVRLRLAPGANYLYKSDSPGILSPLKESDGVIFPYTPTISVSYSASYDSQELTHSNYKVHQYRSSSVDNISITCNFTAQDTFEANYLLAVIHFFRSATKMFYGQDQNPKPGTPPPLCYLTGMGSFQFEQHPLAITGFTYTLPDNVDYIRAGSTANTAGTNLSAYNQKSNANILSALRLGAIQRGGLSAPPNFQKLSNKEPTYVPTKIQLQIACIPLVSRNDISNNFSLQQYSSGKLLRGSGNPGGGGFW